MFFGSINYHDNILHTPVSIISIKSMFVCNLFLLQSALAVAIVNIQIPLLLGDVVNVVSKFTAESTGNFMEEIRQPAMRLISLYGFQV